MKKNLSLLFDRFDNKIVKIGYTNSKVKVDYGLVFSFVSIKAVY